MRRAAALPCAATLAAAGALGLGPGPLGARPAAAQARPNILWITSEDMSPNLGAFGDLYARTPHLDRLAAEGVRYVNAFAPIGVCAPSRSTLIMGLHAPSAGTQHMRSQRTLPAGVKLYSQIVREAGYYATNNAKEDYNLARTPREAWDESSGKAHWRNRKDKRQPFFAIFNLTSSHESQIRQPEAEWKKETATFKPGEVHDPALAPLPPYHPETPEVRRDWARYADAVTFMDREAGQILAELSADGLADDTIVFYYSDHGAGMPRSKRWLYDSSLRVPLVVRFPRRWQHLAPAPPGAVSDRLVSFVDLAATAVALAGGRVPASMQGKPFLTLEGAAAAGPPPEYVYGFRDRMDERYDLLRTVRDRRWRYIRNYMPHRPYAQHISYMYEMPTMQVWQRLFDEGKLLPAQRLFFLEKPAEELYDTWADPHEVTNLAGHAAYRPVLERLRAALDAWMLAIHDTGLLPEAEMIARAAGSTIYEMARDPSRYDPKRVMEAARLAIARDAKAVPKLTALLADKDSAVRFWGASGLAMLGPRAAPAEAALRKALADPAPDVRVTAAEALCALDAGRGAGGARTAGPCARGLEALGQALAHEEDAVRLRAANVLELLGDRAKPLAAVIAAAAAREPDGTYTRRALPRLKARACAGARLEACR
jgi:arylsulfatase A-like enzyme